MTLYELQNGPISYNHDRLGTLFFNPLLLNTRHHLALNSNLDPDENFLGELNNTPCEYYVEDQFNEMFRNECKHGELLCKHNVSFSTLHLNIRSISQNKSRLTDWFMWPRYQIFRYWYY